MYNTELLNAFTSSPYAGDLKGATASATVKSKKFGDIVKISLKINENLIIEQAKYKSFGGVITSVCASAVCELVTNSNLVLAQQITSEDIINHVGTLNDDQKYLASLPVIALMEAIKKFLRKYNKKAA